MVKATSVPYLLLALVVLTVLSIGPYSSSHVPPTNNYSKSPSSKEAMLSSSRRQSQQITVQGSTNRKKKYQLAYEESLGFFDNLDEDHWGLLKEAAMARLESIRSYRPNMMGWMSPMTFYEYFEPDFVCPFERRLGSNEIGDGPKWICDPHRLARIASERRRATQSEAPGCLVYSIGSNGDFSFEESIERFVGKDVCEIHTFDPEPKHADSAPNFVHYHAWGLKPSYEPPSNAVLKMTSTFEMLGVFKTMQETVKELGHDKNRRIVDLFKIDCEGCEWISYKDWIGKDAADIDIRQILIELHEHPDVGYEFFESLLREGYVLFHKEPNAFAPQHNGFGVEHSFLKLSKDFRQIDDRDLIPSRKGNAKGRIA